MLLCPFCDEELHTKTSGGWACACGETIPFGLEKDDDENCAMPGHELPEKEVGASAAWSKPA
jgi:hypothetical protein